MDDIYVIVVICILGCHLSSFLSQDAIVALVRTTVSKINGSKKPYKKKMKKKRMK